jgi:hypothetical protein
MKGLLTFATSLLLLLAAAGPANAQFIPGIEFIEIEKFGDGLYAFRYGPYRNIFMITAEGVIVTDPLDVKAAKILRAEIAKMTDQPVKYVAYSHSHWDHAAGGQIFKDEGDLTFADSYEVELGEHSLGLYYFGPSHDDCMVVMIARPANMMFIVDIGSAPTGWVMEYLKNAEALARREGVTTIVSGHLSLGFDDDGKMQAGSSTGPISAISEKRQFWEAIYAAVRTEMVTGTLVEDVPDKLLASSEFKSEFLDRLGPNGYEKDEMWILLRRVGSYITSGR